MTDSKDAKPWPIWARVLFWAGFACLLIFAIGAAATGGEFDWGTLRIVIVVIAVPGLAVLFVSFVMSRRVKTSMKRLNTQLAHLAQQARQEQSIPESQRGSWATDTSLEDTVAATTAAREAIWHGDPRELATLTQLHQVPVDWRPNSPLAQTMGKCARSTLKLERQLRTLDRQKR